MSTTYIGTAPATYVVGTHPTALRARLKPARASKTARWSITDVAALAGLPVDGVRALQREFEQALDEVRFAARRAVSA